MNPISPIRRSSWASSRYEEGNLAPYTPLEDQAAIPEHQAKGSTSPRITVSAVQLAEPTGEPTVTTAGRA
jgi:hypothetical protein